MLSFRLSFLAVCMVALQGTLALDQRELSAIRELRSLGRLGAHRYGSRALRRRQTGPGQPSPIPLAGTDVVTQPNNECKATSDSSILQNAQNARTVTQLPTGQQFYLHCTARRPETRHG